MNLKVTSLRSLQSIAASWVVRLVFCLPGSALLAQTVFQTNIVWSSNRSNTTNDTAGYLSNGYFSDGDLGGSHPGGGNIQLHKCHQLNQGGKEVVQLLTSQSNANAGPAAFH